MVIDELNRADVDKAFSGLLDLLSDMPQNAYLMHPALTSGIKVPPSFRIICTMNNAEDRHLFSLSQAFSSRFSRLMVGPPPRHLFLEILNTHLTNDASMPLSADNKNAVRVFADIVAALNEMDLTIGFHELTLGARQARNLLSTASLGRNVNLTSNLDQELALLVSQIIKELPTQALGTLKRGLMAYVVFPRTRSVVESEHRVRLQWESSPMPNEQEKADIDYMLRRCIGLCITDKKSAIDQARTIEFRFVDACEADSLSLFEPVCQLIHNFRVLPSFKRTVLRRLQAYASASTQRSLHNEIASSCNDLLSRAAPKYRERLSPADRLEFAIVAEAYFAQAAITTERLRTLGGLKKDSGLNELLGRFCQDLKDVKEAWCQAAKVINLPERDAREVLASNTGPHRRVRNTRVAYPATQWHELWRRRMSGFGPGSKFKFSQTRSPSALYELWCFMEVANGLRLERNSFLQQRSLLRGGKG